MKEPGGEFDHVFGDGLFPINQITERTQSRMNMRNKLTQKSPWAHMKIKHTLTHIRTSLKAAHEAWRLQLCLDYESLLTLPTHEIILNEARNNTHTCTQRHTVNWESYDSNKPPPPKKKNIYLEPLVIWNSKCHTWPTYPRSAHIDANMQPLFKETGTVVRVCGKPNCRWHTWNSHLGQ